MIFPRLPTASRPTAVALLCLLALAEAAGAREFVVRQLSEPNSNARTPSISETGLIAWQGYSPHTGEAVLAVRADVTKSPSGTSRSDIFVWQNGQAQNVTKDHPDIVGRSQQPVASGDAVVFLAWYRSSAGGGYPFTLSIPPKTEEMQQMEADYPTLFDPPLPAPISAVEAADTNAPPAEPLPAALPGTPQEGSLQTQIWRSSGNAGDVAVYRPGTGIERITPGTRHFCAPAMSGAGLALQCARGWPYGYEMLVWRPGSTNLIQITTNYYYVLNPNVRGNELVFQGWDGNDYEIFRYRFDVDQLEQITNNQFDDISPVVWDGRVAWVAHPTVTPEIFYLADGNIRKISEGTQDNGAPAIWKDKVVWQGYDDTDLEIYYFNGRRAIKLTSNTWDDMSPQIHDGLITWMSYVDNWDAEIMAFDLGDNIAVQLTNNEFEDSFPQTAGEKIVWQAIDNNSTSVQLAEPKDARTAPVN
ncbi:MAG: TolB family protein [Kiritimatiellia bacterium]